MLREEGYLRGLEKAGLTVDGALIIRDAAGREDGAAAARQLLDLPRPPTAIVAAVDLGALGAYDAAAERGVLVGRDLAILGYDGSPEGAYASPPLSSYAVDSRFAGERLAALLLRRIRGEHPESLRETASARLVLRGSHSDQTKTSMGGTR
jgi:LacI family transcriptional regulator